jgi:Outer membrane protein beta-barrel domain
MYLNKQPPKLKLLLMVAVFAAMSSAVHAQISVGAVTGVNLNQFTMPGTTIGLNVGAYGAYKITPFLSGRLEITYSQEGGGRQDYSIPLNDPRLANIAGNLSEVNLINPYVYFHNLNVPLMAELTLPEFAEQSVKPKLLLGGSFAYMFSANELHTKQYIFNDNTFSNIPYLREDVGSNYAAAQFSILAGLGFDFKTDKRNFAFDIRYRQGMTQLNDVKASFSNIDGRLFSSTLSFNFSMSIFNF